MHDDDHLADALRYELMRPDGMLTVRAKEPTEADRFADALVPEDAERFNRATGLANGMMASINEFQRELNAAYGMHPSPLGKR